MTSAANVRTSDDINENTPVESTPPCCVALLGNPNTGKTTLLNRLCGLRAQTANFSGSTVEALIGRTTLGGQPCHVIDLPGIYGLNLDRPESEVCRRYLAGEVELGEPAEALVVIADASNLQRNLIFINQALQQGLPCVVALNMMDLAKRRGIRVDTELLSERLGCDVIPVHARSGLGVSALRRAMCEPRRTTAALADPDNAAAATRWAEETYRSCVTVDHARMTASDAMTDRIDRVLTHPILGLIALVVIMTGVFWAIFTFAAIPMDLIELMLGKLGSAIEAIMPPGSVRDLLSNGIIGGISGTVVFLPQICLLFLLISLLEDTGYLARAAFVLDRLLRRFGLPGQAFIPLLTAHACAIPAIMATRLIPDRRDRVATVLIAPFVSCSARIPVYVLLVGIIFIDRPLHQALAFTSCYILGMTAALFTALITRGTVLRGHSSPLVIELPSYKLPSLRTAFATMIDRGWLFLRKVGTIILGICIVLWFLSTYPMSSPPAEALELHTQAAAIEVEQPEQAAELLANADGLTSRHALSRSFVGRAGHAVAPVFKPIGLDWQLTVGVLTSFAAREVFVSTCAVLFAGTDDAEDGAVLKRIANAKRDDGTPVFGLATAASLLVFFVLAMQCLPTLPVTAREAGHWGWAVLQFSYMSTLAYIAALLTHTGFNLWGPG